MRTQVKRFLKTPAWVFGFVWANSEDWNSGYKKKLASIPSSQVEKLQRPSHFSERNAFQRSFSICGYKQYFGCLKFETAACIWKGKNWLVCHRLKSYIKRLIRKLKKQSSNILFCSVYAQNCYTYCSVVLFCRCSNCYRLVLFTLCCGCTYGVPGEQIWSHVLGNWELSSYWNKGDQALEAKWINRE